METLSNGGGGGRIYNFIKYSSAGRLLFASSDLYRLKPIYILDRV